MQFRLSQIVALALIVLTIGCGRDGFFAGNELSIFRIIAEPKAVDGEFVSVSGYLYFDPDPRLYAGEGYANIADISSSIGVEVDVKYSDRFSGCNNGWVSIKGAYSYKAPLMKISPSEVYSFHKNKFCWKSTKN